MLIFLLTELHFSFLTEASLNHLLLDFVHGVIWDSWKKSAQSHQAPFYLLQASYPSYCVLKISQIIFCNTLSLSTCGQSLSMPSAMFPPFFDIKLHRVFFYYILFSFVVGNFHTSVRIFKIFRLSQGFLCFPPGIKSSYFSAPHLYRDHIKSQMVQEMCSYGRSFVQVNLPYIFWDPIKGS